MQCSMRISNFLVIILIFRSDLLGNRTFLSRPFNENFKFLENCPYDIYEILHSHSTPKMLLCVRAQWHQNRMTGIWETAILDFFRFFSKTLLWCLPAPYKDLICAISSKSYDCDWSESEGKIPNPAPLPHMWLWLFQVTKI